MKGLFEILTEKKWMVSPDFVHGIRKSLEHNLNTHAAFSKPEKNCGYVTANDAEGNTYYPEEYQISEDGKQVRGNWCLALPADDEDAQTFPFVSVLTVDGPITRNGGYCSYGSIDHRDMIMRAADHPLCRGHVFIINTPGGSAWAKNDYALAIDYAHSKGQKVIALVDGLCASAGMYLASLCDERYYMNPKDQVGCIGVMAAFYTLADGTVDQFTDETYHELYDPKSFDKNKAYRDIANKDDDKELIKELADLGVEFRADVKKACPNATDEHLHGKVFNAEDVKGILMDGQSSFMGVVQHAFELYDGRAELINREQTAEPEQTATNTNTNINMENYPLICSACGLQAGEIAVTEEGAYMNASLLDSLEAHMKEAEQKVTDAEQKATTAENALAELQGKFDELSANVNAAKEAKEVAETALAEAKEAHSKELSDLNAQHAEALAKKDDELKALSEAKDKEIADLTAAKTETEANLQGAKDALATAEQSLADKQAQIDELTHDAGAEQNAGNAPENNGEGANIKHAQTGYPKWNQADPVGSKKAIDEYKRKNGIL
ncbi:S49 family peptidase [uncultured Prevotella sp.]|uniref:S49 family peptidase n=1 Tax=uncultured Prevotella sp. TaxID=159272 RepID=UPI00266BE810|nr:S49 family peptidase [uncultured Prevotella sp.]